MLEILKDNVGTFRNFGLRMTSKPSDAPQVKRSTVSPLRAQGVLDFSRGADNEPFFGERTLPYSFSRVIDRYEEREQLAHEIRQWAYGYTDGQLFDTTTPNYYFKNASCIGCELGELKDKLFTVKLTFVAYPRKIHLYAEGHDLWDVFDFDNDVWQENVVRLPPIIERAPYKELAIGDKVILAGWVFRTLGGTDFSSQTYDEFYTIKEIRPYANDPYTGSEREYYLDELQAWFREAWLIQAHDKMLEVELINTSSFPVIPQIMLNSHGDGSQSYGGITLETDTGAFYAMRGALMANGRRTNDVYNTSFALLPGSNKFKLYGSQLDVSFIWHKEVI